MKNIFKLAIIGLIAVMLHLSNNSVFSQCVQCGPGTFISSTTGNGAISMGHYINNTGTRSIIIGEGYSEQYPLSNSYSHRLLIGINSTKPTIFVSESPWSVLHDKTGKVGIGNVINPLAKLHIKADDAEVAALFVEPKTWTPDAYAML